MILQKQKVFVKEEKKITLVKSLWMCVFNYQTEAVNIQLWVDCFQAFTFITSNCVSGKLISQIFIMVSTLINLTHDKLHAEPIGIISSIWNTAPYIIYVDVLCLSKSNFANSKPDVINCPHDHIILPSLKCSFAKCPSQMIIK